MLRRLSISWLIISFLSTLVIPVQRVQASPALPVPGTMVNLSPAYEPVLMKGLKVHPENPFLFDFILDLGDNHPVVDPSSKKAGPLPGGEEVRRQAAKLIKYFLASLTIPEKDLWVNLSPYEKDRMIAPNLGQTEMGRDMLAQDYILKQLTASLIYPEKHLGKAFWDEVYAKARAMYGTTQVPVNTFNKVWIVADKADVFERGNVAYVVGAHLKVMLEEDYLALQKSKNSLSFPNAFVGNPDKAHSIASQIIKRIILPQIEKEVNQGKNFAPLRQMFYSMVLASWYKVALKDAILTQIYGNKSKVKGLERGSQQNLSPEQIYEQYLKAYKKGVFNYIKEDIDQANRQPIPRKYFSGGLNMAMLGNAMMPNRMHTFPADAAQSTDRLVIVTGDAFIKNVRRNGNQASKAMSTDNEDERSGRVQPNKHIDMPNRKNFMAYRDSIRIKRLLKIKGRYDYDSPADRKLYGIKTQFSSNDPLRIFNELLSLKSTDFLYWWFSNGNGKLSSISVPEARDLGEFIYGLKFIIYEDGSRIVIFIPKPGMTRDHFSAAMKAAASRDVSMPDIGEELIRDVSGKSWFISTYVNLLPKAEAILTQADNDFEVAVAVSTNAAMTISPLEDIADAKGLWLSDGLSNLSVVSFSNILNFIDGTISNLDYLKDRNGDYRIDRIFEYPEYRNTIRIMNLLKANRRGKQYYSGAVFPLDSPGHEVSAEMAGELRESLEELRYDVQIILSKRKVLPGEGSVLLIPLSEMDHIRKINLLVARPSGRPLTHSIEIIPENDKRQLSAYLIVNKDRTYLGYALYSGHTLTINSNLSRLVSLKYDKNGVHIRNFRAAPVQYIMTPSTAKLPSRRIKIVDLSSQLSGQIIDITGWNDPVGIALASKGYDFEAYGYWQKPKEKIELKRGQIALSWNDRSVVFILPNENRLISMLAKLSQADPWLANKFLQYLDTKSAAMISGYRLHGVWEALASGMVPGHPIITSLKRLMAKTTLLDIQALPPLSRQAIEVYEKETEVQGRTLPTISITEADLGYENEIYRSIPKPVLPVDSILASLPVSIDQIPEVWVNMLPENIYLVSKVRNGTEGIVRLGILHPKNGPPRFVAVKTFIIDGEDSREQRILKEYRGAYLAHNLRTRYGKSFGPQVHGIYMDENKRWNIVLDVVPGDFSENNGHAITIKTYRQLRNLKELLHSENLPLSGDFQYYVTPEGDIQVLDAGDLISRYGKDEYDYFVTFLVRDADREDVQKAILLEMKQKEPRVFDRLRYTIADLAPRDPKVIMLKKSYQEVLGLAVPAMIVQGADTAMKTRGGIDFNRSNMQMYVRKEGPRVQMRFDPAMVARIKREGFDGLDFHIQNIVPVSDFSSLLGLNVSEVNSP